MARFDIYRNPGQSKSTTPYLLDVQSGWLDNLDTRVVVPLRRMNQFSDVPLPTRLMPTVRVEGHLCMMETPKLAAIPARMLKEPLESIADQQQAIDDALDFLFHGF